jgi:hypothetical protein
MTTISTFAIDRVFCFADNFVVTESLVLRLNICAKKPATLQNRKPLANILKNLKT